MKRKSMEVDVWIHTDERHGWILGDLTFYLSSYV